MLLKHHAGKGQKKSRASTWIETRVRLKFSKQRNHTGKLGNLSDRIFETVAEKKRQAVGGFGSALALCFQHQIRSMGGRQG